MGSVYEDLGRRSVSAPTMTPCGLARLIEGEIIPRLLTAHRTAPAAGFADGAALAFAHLSIAADVAHLLAEVDAHLARHVPLASVYLDLLAPTARVLGDFWDNDVCDFVDVTMGMWRLQQVIYALGERTPTPPAAVRPGRRALFAVAPGDQHSFGVVMVEDFFRRAGWRTWSVPAAEAAQLCDFVARQRVELVGLTVSTLDHLATLPALVADLRAASRNPALAVMVGGKAFTERPELAIATGADATAADAPQALIAAERLVERAGRLDHGG